MSTPNCYFLKCILCYCPYDFNWSVGQFSAQLIPAVISSYLKHIPPDIHKTVDWNQLDANNCLRLCNTCDGNLKNLAKLNCELEEIQRKINELANCISLYVRKERGKYEPTLPPIQKEPDNSYRKDADRNPEKQLLGPDHSTLENQNSSSLSNENKAVRDNDVMEFINADDNNDGFLSDKEEANQSTFPLSANAFEDSTLNIQDKEIEEPTRRKSNMQRKPKGPNNAGFECSTCHKRFSRYTILKNHDCEKPTVECETCGLSFSSSGVLKLHTRSHTGEKPYKCELCDKAFSIKANLRAHVVQVHTKEKLFGCKICGKKFSSQASIIKHKITHTDEAKFDCEVCGKSFKSFKYLEWHLVTHSMGTSHPFECDLCDKTYTLAKSLTTHKNRVHFGVKFADCEICGQSLYDKSSFIKHMGGHSGEYPFQCSFCGKKFRGAEGLKHHEKTHTDVGEFPCNICGKACHNSNSLKWHRRRYHQENEIQCEICGKQIFKASMKDHLRSHSKTGIKCDICGNAFKSTTNLKLHQMIHAGKNPFECKTCGQTFKTKKNLKKHEWTHLEEGKFPCDLCGKVFNNSRLLKVHMRIHNNTIITCDICGKLVCKNRLPGHKKAHNRETEFKCNICERNFTSKTAQNNHFNYYCHICDGLLPRCDDAALLRHQIAMHTVNSTLYPSDDEVIKEVKQQSVHKKKKRNLRFPTKQLQDDLSKRQLKVQLTKLNKHAIKDFHNDKKGKQNIVSTRGGKRKVNYKESFSEDETKAENSSENEIKSENSSGEDEFVDIQVKVEVKSENEFSDIDDSDC